MPKIKKLEELLTENSTLDDLSVLLEQPFEITPEGVKLIDIIEKKHQTEYYSQDYSVAGTLFLSYVYHRLNEKGLSQGQSFLRLRLSRIRS